MPFIGNQPTQGRFIELDSLTASATANYTLQLNSANFEPESVNNLLVSINGVIQGSSTMSLNGAVLTVGATLSSSDTIDFVRVFGNVGTVSTPTDGSVTANKIGTGAVTSAKIADGTIVNADINASAGISGSKLGTGAILQVVPQAISADVANITSTSYHSSGLTLSITPSATSSKILLLFSTSTYVVAGGVISVSIHRNITSSTNANTQVSGGTNLDTSSNNYGLSHNFSETGSQITPCSAMFLDSPSSTNAQTYTLTYRSQNGNSCAIFANSQIGSLIAQEIGG